MSAVPAPLGVAALVVGALVVTRLSGLILRFVVRRVAERSAVGNVTRWWRAGTSRGVLDAIDGGERRRRQRVDSAARMLNHLVAFVVWIGVTIAVFHVLDIDAAFMLSSAGFIGAAVAFGGQHKVNDYLTCLSVLFEDRYGVGDTVVVELAGREPIQGVVEHIGLFTTRLRDQDGTLHIPNAGFQLVRNLSQAAHTETLHLHVDDAPAPVDERRAADTVRRMAGQEHLTDVIFVGDIAAAHRGNGDIEVAVRTARPLASRERQTLISRVERSLRGQ